MWYSVFPSMPATRICTCPPTAGRDLGPCRQAVVGILAELNVNLAPGLRDVDRVQSHLGIRRRGHGSGGNHGHGCGCNEAGIGGQSRLHVHELCRTRRGRWYEPSALIVPTVPDPPGVPFTDHVTAEVATPPANAPN